MIKKPLSGTFEEWDKWEDDTKKEHPIWYFLQETLPSFFRRQKYKINNIKWWFLHRFHPRYRYNIIRTGLKPGYYDSDHLMLHGCFNLLKDFVEIEKPFEHFETEDSEYKDKWDEIRFLYNWWVKKRPARKPYEYTLKGKGFNLLPGEEAEVIKKMKQEIQWNNEDNEMLVRLVKIRDMMWT